MIAAFVMVWVAVFAIDSGVSTNAMVAGDPSTLTSMSALQHTQVLAIVFVVVLYLAYIWYSVSPWMSLAGGKIVLVQF